MLPERQLTRLLFVFSFQQIKFSALRADPNRDMLAVVGHGAAMATRMHQRSFMTECGGVVVTG